MAWRLQLILVLVVGGGLAVAMETSKGEWELATDVQKYYRCLPFNWYVVVPVETPKSIQRGDLVRFRAPANVERLTSAYEVIKLVGAVEGDHWKIEKDHLSINGNDWGALHLLNTLGSERGDFDGEGTVPPGHLYVLGTNPSSYDSRYWGPLSMDQVNGKAYVVF